MTVHDKYLRGEPDVGLVIVDTSDDDANRIGSELCLKLAEQGRGRCAHHVKEIETGFAYRVGSLIRVPEHE